jgi:hypothetical protein
MEIYKIISGHERELDTKKNSLMNKKGTNLDLNWKLEDTLDKSNNFQE